MCRIRRAQGRTFPIFAPLRENLTQGRAEKSLEFPNTRLPKDIEHQPLRILLHGGCIP